MAAHRLQRNLHVEKSSEASFQRPQRPSAATPLQDGQVALAATFHAAATHKEFPHFA